MYQGILDNCEDVGITEAEFHEAQAPMKPTIRRADLIDYEQMRKYFGHVPADIIRQTFKHPTQIGLLPPFTHLHRQFKSPNPALNLHRRNEANATDQIFATEPTTDGGETSAHIFVGQDSKITDVYKSKDNSEESFLGAFQNRVRERGVPIKLIADNCPMYRDWNVTKYLQDSVVSMWQCETKHQNQNPAKNQYRTVKQHTDRTMNRSGAPGYAWLLCLVYICLCLNNYIDPKLGDGTKYPIMMCCFAKNDISMLLNFYSWQPVYYLVDPEDQSFSENLRKKRARWAGVDEKIGAKMCYKLVDEESGMIIYRSVIRAATEPGSSNLRVDPIKPLLPTDTVLDEMMTAADFKTPVSDDQKKVPTFSILSTTNTMNWREI